MDLKINHQMVAGSEDLRNFPSYFTAQRTEFSAAQPSGADFVFTASDGVSKLSHEIRFWDSSECRLAAYVKIPILSAREDTRLFLYFGNPSAPDQQDREGVWADYQYVRHIGGLPKERPAPREGRGGTIGSVDFFKLQIGVLRSLFGEEWFKSGSKSLHQHPAARSWRFCSRMLESGGRLAAESRAQLHESALELAQVLSGTTSLVQATRGNLDWFELGNLSNYGNESVIKRLRGVLPEPRQYWDVLSEIRCVAWYSARGHQIQVMEEPACADFRIDIQGWGLPVVSDCKHLSTGAANTLKRRIQKANNQIKNVGVPCFGLVILDLADLVNKPRPLSDEIPPEIMTCISLVQGLLSGWIYSSVSGALLLWDEVSLLGPEPDGRGMLLAVRTRSVLVRHANPLCELPPETREIQIESTISTFIRFSERKWE
ncbi:MAG: DUF2341 domain-containing protein [Bryobacteraceae bacterium]